MLAITDAVRTRPHIKNMWHVAYAILPTTLSTAIEQVMIQRNTLWDWQAPLVATAVIETLSETDTLDTLFDSIQQAQYTRSGTPRI